MEKNPKYPVPKVPKKGGNILKIIFNKEVGPDIFHLVLKYESLNEIPKPGQFFNLKVSETGCDDPLLRRPLSIFDHQKEEKIIEFVYKLVGKGTKILSRMKKGKEIDILGPLGESFSLSTAKKIDIIGGGMGIAPLYYLSKNLEAKNINIYLGACNKKELEFFEAKFAEVGINIHLAAVEEKLEIQGTALELWQNYLEQNKPDFIYSCGPKKMLAVVEKKCLENDITGEISVEIRMGCGIGVCLSCSCEAKEEGEKNKRACVEGPVFALGEVVLN